MRRTLVVNPADLKLSGHGDHIVLWRIVLVAVGEYQPHVQGKLRCCPAHKYSGIITIYYYFICIQYFLFKLSLKAYLSVNVSDPGDKNTSKI